MSGAAGVNNELAAGCLGVLELNSEFVNDGAGLAADGVSLAFSSAGLGANNELALDGFGVLELKSEVVENEGAGLTVEGASGSFSVAGVGVAGTVALLPTFAKRFLAGAVAGGATLKPAKGLLGLGAGVALTAGWLLLSGNVIRPNRSPPAGAGAFGVAALSIACSG